MNPDTPLRNLRPHTAVILAQVRLDMAGSMSCSSTAGGGGQPKGCGWRFAAGQSWGFRHPPHQCLRLGTRMREVLKKRPAQSWVVSVIFPSGERWVIVKWLYKCTNRCRILFDNWMLLSCEETACEPVTRCYKTIQDWDDLGCDHQRISWFNRLAVSLFSQSGNLMQFDSARGHQQL